MRRRRNKSSTGNLNVRDWVLETVRAASIEGTPVPTTRIEREIAKRSGKTFHRNSIYNALRALKNQGLLREQKKGNSKTYVLAATPALRATPPTSKHVTTPTGSGTAHAVAKPPIALPHKLAWGEVLVLSVGDDHIETATNFFGHMVVQKHRRVK
jgi:hypothetical protein